MEDLDKWLLAFTEPGIIGPMYDIRSTQLRLDTRLRDNPAGFYVFGRLSLRSDVQGGIVIPPEVTAALELPMAATRELWQLYEK